MKSIQKSGPHLHYKVLYFPEIKSPAKRFDGVPIKGVQIDIKHLKSPHPNSPVEKTVKYTFFFSIISSIMDEGRFILLKIKANQFNTCVIAGLSRLMCVSKYNQRIF